MKYMKACLRAASQTVPASDTRAALATMCCAPLRRDGDKACKAKHTSALASATAAWHSYALSHTVIWRRTLMRQEDCRAPALELFEAPFASAVYV